ncbi:SRSF protein kinase 1 [Cucurbita argyrosperma subsp. argyrosperma]|nr:SRSF protein kinase 1 [Cucurbita argyrosperma subsp. argyrosperma]
MRQYRCPEVFLGSKYSTPADMWSFACICFELAAGDVLSNNYERDQDSGSFRNDGELHGMMPPKMLTEKYDFSEQDANDLADFLVPLLDFAPRKRPRAAQCLSHPWLSSVQRILESSVSTHQNQSEDQDASTKRSEKDEREAMEIGMGNIAID